MQAVFEDTAPAPDSPWVMPGHYTVRLTAAGKSLSQPLTVKMDPRVRTSLAGLSQQFTLSMQIYDDVRASSKTMEEMHAFGEQLHERLKTDNSEKLVELEKNVRALEGEPAGRAGRRGASGPDTFSSVSGTLTGLLQGLQEADAAPTPATVAAVADRRAALKKLMRRWDELKAQ
jgi:hypothetical protein